MRDAKPLARSAGADKQAFADILPGIEAHRIAIVNGAYCAGVERTPTTPIPASRWSSCFAWLGDQLNARQDQIGDEQDIALALNAAFMTGGCRAARAQGRPRREGRSTWPMFSRATRRPRCFRARSSSSSRARR